MSDHDPFNDPDLAHPNARKLMKEDFFWDCGDEFAPFGSDEGADAYAEWRLWRKKNPAKPLKECLKWILDGRLNDYNLSLCTDKQIEQDLEDPDSAFLADHFDMFTLDATIIATALGQLMDEGKIDVDAKPYVSVALTRQLHARVCDDDERRSILIATRRVLQDA